MVWGLPERMARNLLQFCQDLSQLYGDDLESVVLYGSTVTGEFAPGTSDINLLVMLSEIDSDQLKRGLEVMKRAWKQGIAHPLFLSYGELRHSLDVFPIEFLDIQAHHQVLYGSDPFVDLPIALDNLRHQCELELRAKVLRARQSFLEVGLSPKALKSIASRSITSLVPVFRNLLRLKGEEPPVKHLEVIARTAQEFDADAEVLSLALRIKREEEKLPKDEMLAFFQTYLDELQKIAMAVDRMKPGKEGGESDRPPSRSG